jgi:hypothetical protein
VASARPSSIPLFKGSFTADGVTYPYTMAGGAPQLGGTTRIQTVLFALDVLFEGTGPGGATERVTTSDIVADILASPVFTPAPFANGLLQAEDSAQRASFDAVAGPDWHTILQAPAIRRATIRVPLGLGAVIHDAADRHIRFARVNFDYMEDQLRQILDEAELPPSVLPIFVSHNVFEQLRAPDGTVVAVNFSSTDVRDVVDEGGRRGIQTRAWAMWLDDPAIDLFANSSMLTAAIAQLTLDPLFINRAPAYTTPNPEVNDGCFDHLGQPFLSKAMPISVQGLEYLVENVPMLSWFARQTPSTAVGGAYSWPDTTLLTQPSEACAL